MLFTLKVVSVLLGLRSVAAQTATAPTAVVDTSASDLGILQLVTPTTHASQVAVTALLQLSDDALSFYTSYSQIDSFDFKSALVQAIMATPTLVAGDDRIISIWADGLTSLLNDPTAYISRLQASASPYPSTFSSSLVSQASGLLLGFESLVTQDILSMNATQAPVTPGMSISVGPAGPVGSGMSQASQGTGTMMPPGSTSTSKAAGMPRASANAQVMINAAAAAVGVLGLAWM